MLGGNVWRANANTNEVLKLDEETTQWSSAGQMIKKRNGHAITITKINSSKCK